MKMTGKIPTMTDPSFDRAFHNRDPAMELLKKMDQSRRDLEEVMGDYVEGEVLESDGSSGSESLRLPQLENEKTGDEQIQ